jgi:hypothetical protein
MQTTTRKTNQRPAKTRQPAYSVRYGIIRHENGVWCKAWHAFAGDIQVGGCFKTKREAAAELNSFRRDMFAAIGDI